LTSEDARMMKEGTAGKRKFTSLTIR